MYFVSLNKFGFCGQVCWAIRYNFAKVKVPRSNPNNSSLSDCELQTADYVHCCS